MTCNKFNSTGDVGNSGAIDMKAKTSLKYWTEQANDTLSLGVVEIQPASPPVQTGQVKRVKTLTGSQTVVYPDGTDTNVVIAEMEWYTPPGSSSWVPRNGMSLYVDQFCSTPGTYDQTCLTNALIAASSGDTLIFNRAFTFSATGTISGLQRLRLLGLEGGSVALANGVNNSVLRLTNCHGCRIEGLIIDGNKTNQTGTSYGIEIINSSGAILTLNVFRNNRHEPIYEERNAVSTSLPLPSPGDYYDGILISGNQFLKPGGSIIWLNYSSTFYSQFSTANILSNYIDAVDGSSGTARNQSVTTFKRVDSLNWLNNTYVNNFNAAISSGVQSLFYLDTTSTALNALNAYYDAGILSQVANGATTSRLIYSFPTYQTNSQTFQAASCLGTTGVLGPNFSSTAALTVSCSDATSPLSVASVPLNSTDYLVFSTPGRFPNTLIQGNFAINIIGYVTTGTGNSFLEVSWACADGGDDFLNPTWNSVTQSGLGSPTANRLLILGGFGLTPSDLTTAGCNFSSGNDTSVVYVRVRKSASSTHTGTQKIVKASLTYVVPVGQ
jgi:hypothetical protein